jgi:hypothetical protein
VASADHHRLSSRLPAVVSGGSATGGLKKGVSIDPYERPCGICPRKLRGHRAVLGPAGRHLFVLLHTAVSEPADRAAQDGDSLALLASAGTFSARHMTSLSALVAKRCSNRRAASHTGVRKVPMTSPRKDTR